MSTLDRLAESAEKFFESKLMHFIVIGMVLAIGAMSGLSTFPEFKSYNEIFETIDRVILAIFVIEMLVKIILLRGRFFKSYWNVIDFIVIALSLMPNSIAYTFRLLRFLHVMSSLELLPRTKHIVDGLVHALPGLANVFIVSMVIFYMFALMSTAMFGTHLSTEFGTVGLSMYTLLKVVTGGVSWVVITEQLHTIGLSSTLFFSLLLFVSYFLVALMIGAVISAVLRVEERFEPRKGTTDLRQELSKIQRDLKEIRGDLKRRK